MKAMSDFYKLNLDLLIISIVVFLVKGGTSFWEPVRKEHHVRKELFLLSAKLKKAFGFYGKYLTFTIV